MITINTSTGQEQACSKINRLDRQYKQKKKPQKIYLNFGVKIAGKAKKTCSATSNAYIINVNFHSKN